VPSGLTETGQDLLSHLQNGYPLETESLGRRSAAAQAQKQRSRPVPIGDAQYGKGIAERGLIAPAEGDDPLRVVWHLQKTKAAKKSRH